jgi:hypothetical protein
VSGLYRSRLPEKVRDVTFGEDAATSRTGSGPANLATIRAAIRAAIIAALKDAGYLHIPEGRRDHATPAETLRLHGLDLGQKRTFTEHAGALAGLAESGNRHGLKLFG